MLMQLKEMLGCLPGQNNDSILFSHNRLCRFLSFFVVAWNLLKKLPTSQQCRLSFLVVVFEEKQAWVSFGAKDLSFSCRFDLDVLQFLDT